MKWYASEGNIWWFQNNLSQVNLQHRKQYFAYQDSWNNFEMNIIARHEAVKVPLSQPTKWVKQ
jgi:hypothetical protein